MLDLNPVVDAIQVKFIHRSNEVVETIPKIRVAQISEKNIASLNVDLKIFKERIRNLNKETLVVDSTGRKIMVFSGGSQLYSLDVWTILES